MSIYEIFFDLTLNICDRFPSLSPFDVRREKAREVFLLIKRMGTAQKRDRKVIRKKADDSWF